MWCLLPGEFGDVEYRSLRADTHVALGGFSTQHKQAPMPQAIMFSSETRQAYPFCRDSAATAFIIGTGPQAATKSNCCAFHTEC